MAASLPPEARSTTAIATDRPSDASRPARAARSSNDIVEGREVRGSASKVKCSGPTELLSPRRGYSARSLRDVHNELGSLRGGVRRIGVQPTQDGSATDTPRAKIRRYSVAALLVAIVGTSFISVQFGSSLRGSGYWSHRANWGRETNDLLDLITIEGPLLRKHFTFVALGRELSGESLVVPSHVIATNLDFQTARASWLADVGIIECEYDPEFASLSDLQAQTLDIRHTATNPSVSETYEEAFSRLSSGRLVIVDSSDDSPYFLLTPEGSPGSEGPIWVVQRGALLEAGLSAANSECRDLAPL